MAISANTGEKVTIEGDMRPIMEKVLGTVVESVLTESGPRLATYYFHGKVLGEEEANFAKRREAAIKFITEYLKKVDGREFEVDVIEAVYKYCNLRWAMDFHKKYYQYEYLVNPPDSQDSKKLGGIKEGKASKERIRGWADKLKLRKKWQKAVLVVLLLIVLSGTTAGLVVEAKMPGFIRNIPALLSSYSSNEQLTSIVDSALNGAMPVSDPLATDDIAEIANALGVFTPDPTAEFTKQVGEVPASPINTSTPVPTNTLIPTITPDPSKTPVPTDEPTLTSTPSPSNTPITPTATLTYTPVIPTVTSTNTPDPTNTATPEPTETLVPPTSTLVPFTPTMVPTEEPPTPEPTVEVQRTYNPYTYFKQSLLTKLDEAEALATSNGELLRIIRSLREQILNKDRIVIDLIITDRSVYGTATNDRSYYSHGQEHIGNSDGVIQLVFQESGVYIFFFGRDLRARYLIDGQLGNWTTLEMLGSPRLNDPKNADGTFKTYSDDATEVLESLSGLDGDIGIKLSLGMMNTLFAGLLPNGVDISISQGFTTEQVNFQPGVPQHLNGEQFIHLLRQRKGIGQDAALNSYARGSEVLKRIISNPENIANLMSAADFSSFWQMLFSQNLNDDVQSFQVHGGQEAVLFYELMGMMAGTNFSADMAGLLMNSATMGKLYIVTIQPPASGEDPLVSYQNQVNTALN